MKKKTPKEDEEYPSEIPPLFENTSFLCEFHQYEIGDETECEPAFLFWNSKERGGGKLERTPLDESIGSFLDDNLSMVLDSSVKAKDLSENEIELHLSSYGAVDKNCNVRGAVSNLSTVGNPLLGFADVLMSVFVNPSRDVYVLQKYADQYLESKKSPFAGFDFLEESVVPPLREDKNPRYLTRCWGDLVERGTILELIDRHDESGCKDFCNSLEYFVEDKFLQAHLGKGWKILPLFGYEKKDDSEDPVLLSEYISPKIVFYEISCVAPEPQQFFIYLVDLDSSEYELFRNSPSEDPKDKRSILANSWLLRREMGKYL